MVSCDVSVAWGIVLKPRRRYLGTASLFFAGLAVILDRHPAALANVMIVSFNSSKRSPPGLKWAFMQSASCAKLRRLQVTSHGYATCDRDGANAVPLPAL